MSKLDRAFRIVGYLPDYRLDSLDPMQVRYVTDLIYFSLEPLPNGELKQDRVPPEALQKLHDLTRGSATCLLVAVGGWERSGGFAPMVTHPEARKRFVENLTRYCVTNRLDGVEFDWEGPGNPQEEAGYTALMQEAKQNFAPHKLRVTVAQASWDNLGRAGLHAVDEVHVMAYDHDGQHSTFVQAQADMQSFVKKGVPKRKLIMGLPFYGRNVYDRNKDMTYADIVRQYHPAPNSDMAGDIYFNNLKTIEQKTKYAKNEGFGGVMAWELGQDTADNVSLIRAIHHAAQQ